jgi:hypothetical protein
MTVLHKKRGRACRPLLVRTVPPRPGIWNPITPPPSTVPATVATPAAMAPTSTSTPTRMAIAVSVSVMRIPAIMPAAGHPRAAIAGDGPITRCPDVSWSRANRRCCHHRWPGVHWRGHHCCRNDRRRHQKRRRWRQWETEKAEMNSGMGGQSRRANQCGREQYFSFHSFIFYAWFTYRACGIRRLPSPPLRETLRNLAEELKAFKCLWFWL